MREGTLLVLGQKAQGVTIAHLSTMSTFLANPKAWLHISEISLKTKQ